MIRHLAAVGGVLALSFTPAHAPEHTDAAVYLGQMTTVDVRIYVRDRAADLGWVGKQWQCLHDLIHNESRWNMTADNPESTAYGLFQQLRVPVGTGLEKQTRLGPANCTPPQSATSRTIGSPM